MIWTIGHSNIAVERFIDLLVMNGVHTLVDVRSHPGSTHVPQFNKEELRLTLEDAALDYIHLPQLGGWVPSLGRDIAPEAEAAGVTVGVYTAAAFPKQRIAKKRPVPEGQTGWTNWGFYDYSWYMASEDFHQGILKLLINAAGRCAICCGEALWWKCHRSMIADVLAAYTSEEVQHIMPDGHLVPHILGDRLQRYDPHIVARWERWF